MNSEEKKLRIFEAVMASDLDPSHKWPFIKWGEKQIAEDADHIKRLLNESSDAPSKVECTITRMELVPCEFGGVEFGYAAIDAKGKKYLLSHYGSDEVATAEVLRLAHSTMTSAGAVRLEDLIGRKILVMPSESNALLLPLEFV